MHSVCNTLLIIIILSCIIRTEEACFQWWFIGLFTHNFHTSLKITILTAFCMDTARQLHLTVHKSNSLCTQFSQAAESIWICQDFILKSINAPAYSCSFSLLTISLFHEFIQLQKKMAHWYKQSFISLQGNLIRREGDTKRVTISPPAIKVNSCEIL